MKTCTVVTLLLVLMMTGADTRAQESPWHPPYPELRSLVWIRLPSGEWLAGHVTSLRDKNFVFESEELDELHLDWDDVVELRSAVPLTLTFAELGTVTGTVTVLHSVISVRTRDLVLQYPRSSLLSIIEGEQTEWNYWSLNASAGIVARSGNTDQDDFNLRGFIRREAGPTRFDIEYTGNFGTVGGEKTVHSHSGSARFDWLIMQGFFVTPFNMTLFSDRFQNIDLRSTFGVGVGYFVTRTKDIEWSVSFGGGHQSTRYTSVLPGQELVKGTAIIIPGTILDMDLTGALEMKGEYYAQIGLAEPQNTFHHTDVQFKLDVLNDILGFTLSFTWDHNTNPQADENGIVPQKTDLRTSFGIGIDI